jgi:Ca2+-binding RTX toxin-like protein
MATIPSDPLFSNQWHLRNTTPGLLDLNVVDVWDDYTGAGVEVAVIDDAVQRTHPDLDGNYSILKDWDFGNNDTNPSGGNGDRHGTAVAGIIGANEGNGIGGVGIAYDATIFGFGINYDSTLVQRATEAINNASGLQQQSGINREADVVNMSFSTYSYFDVGRNSTQMAALNTAIDNAAIFGRDGLGTILVKSAGNRRTSNFDTNAMSWNANPHTISVAAVDQDGDVSWYSSHGASVLVSAFGTPGQVVTTDRVGSAGYTSGNYTSTFNGTSAATPMVSGVVALMLEANPNLGWRDVQEILAYSARHVGTNVGSGTSGNEKYAWAFNGANNWNGGGLHFSNDYGFGLVDAKAAVRLAETWGSNSQTSANDSVVFRDFLNSSTTINVGNNGNGGTSFSRFIGSNIEIEHVEVDINFTQWHDLGDLELRLISPDGTSSILIDNSGENNGSSSGGFGSGRWEFFSHAFRGEDTTGTWTVQLFDADSNTVSPITINDIDITFHGQAASNDDTFIFTEEYSNYDGLFGHRRSINGGIGTDTINAAAVDSNTTVNLTAGTGSIDGVAITTSSIENVFSGDGDDLLIGNAFNNRLSGMRGNDTLYGQGGADTLIGGSGNDLLDSDTLFTLDTIGDRLEGGAGNDTLRGEAGDDTLDGGSGNDSLDGGRGDDRLYGQGGADTLIGGSGNDLLDSDTLFTLDTIGDRLDGGAGNDTLRGEAGDDTLDGGSGNDSLNGGRGDDTLNGGSGADTVNGGAGNDTVIDDDFVNFDNHDGGAGIDTIDYSNVTFGAGLVTINLATETTSVNFSGGNTETVANFENVEGSQGGETIIGTTSANRLDGNGGDDTINGGAGHDTLDGGAGDDSLNGGSGNDRLYGQGGADTLIGGSGNDLLDSDTLFTLDTIGDRLEGGAGNDTLRGEAGDDTLDGGSGNDSLDGRSGDDTLYGQGGADTLIGGSGDDRLDSDTLLAVDTIGDLLDGGDGNDTLQGEAGDDTLLGGDGNDRLTGDDSSANFGDDRLEGGAGNDTLTGAGGNDTLIGGSGSDVLSGTNSILDGAGEIDVFNPGDYGASDRIILGTQTSIYYNGAGLDYAVIDNFDRFNFSSETDSDKLQIHGSLSNYTLNSFTGTVAGISMTNGTRIGIGGEIVAYVDSGGLLTANDFVSV